MGVARGGRGEHGIILWKRCVKKTLLQEVSQREEGEPAKSGVVCIRWVCPVGERSFDKNATRTQTK